MAPSFYGTCFMYTDKCLANVSRYSNAARGVGCLQTEDTAYACNEPISDSEERLGKDFDY